MQQIKYKHWVFKGFVFFTLADTTVELQFHRIANTEEENFWVLTFLVMKYGSKVLQEKIRQELLDSQGLNDFLEKEKHFIFHLTLYNTYRCCLDKCDITQNYAHLSREYLKRMYYMKKQFCTDKPGYYCFCCLVPDRHVDISQWDITLTSSILLNILLKDCQSGHKDILDLRELRNSILHMGNTLLSDDKYIKLFKNVSDKIKAIAKTCGDHFYQTISEEINNLKKNRLFPRELKEAQEYWKEQKKVNNGIFMINFIYTMLLH